MREAKEVFAQCGGLEAMKEQIQENKDITTIFKLIEFSNFQKETYQNANQKCEASSHKHELENEFAKSFISKFNSNFDRLLEQAINEKTFYIFLSTRTDNNTILNEEHPLIRTLVSKLKMHDYDVTIINTPEYNYEKPINYNPTLVDGIERNKPSHMNGGIIVSWFNEDLGQE